MAIGQETLRVLNEIDAATTAIGERIEALVAGADLTDEEKAAFQVQIDRLKALGTDPNDPVPS